MVDRPPPANPEQAADIAISDLAERIGIDASGISVVIAEEHTWNDGSIGCPVAGRMYTQALVPGFRVILSAAEEEFAYHAAQGRALFYCPTPTVKPSPDS